MPDFASLADAVTRVVELAARRVIDEGATLAVTDDPLLCAALVDAGCDAELATIERTDDGVTVLATRSAESVVVVLVGIETGRTAAAIADAVRSHGAQRIVLVTGVLPRQSRTVLGARFDDYAALVEPLAPRALRWHIG